MLTAYMISSYWVPDIPSIVSPNRIAAERLKLFPRSCVIRTALAGLSEATLTYSTSRTCSIRVLLPAISAIWTMNNYRFRGFFPATICNNYNFHVILPCFLVLVQPTRILHPFAIPVNPQFRSALYWFLLLQQSLVRATTLHNHQDLRESARKHLIM